MKKLLLGLTIAYTSSFCNINTMDQEDSTTDEDERLIEEEKILSSSEYKKSVYAIVNKILDNYSKVNVITQELYKTLMSLPESQLSTPHDGHHLWTRQIDAIIIIDLMYNIIINNINNKKLDYNKPTCICEVKIPKNIILELNIRLYQNEKQKISSYILIKIGNYILIIIMLVIHGYQHYQHRI